MKTIFTSALLLLTLLSFAQNNPCSCTDCRCADSLELVKLYNATDGANWTNKWDLTQPMYTWYSAIPMLENGRVTYIDLQQNGLNGTIPNLNLPKLKELFLSDYNLTGSLPNFTLPALEMLFITNSQVSGTLPDFNLPNLQSLAVGGCPFITGTIPAFNNMPNLRQLALSGNQLSGTIPNFTQSLTSLQLGGNLLSGTIPNFSMPNLTTLELDGNQLTGSIPNFNLQKLQYLSVGGNQLTGAIPELHLPTLLSLNAAYNQLGGSLPSFNYLPLLNVLNLSNNQLSGAAPDFGSKSPLYTIDLSYNQLTGSTPAYNLSLLVNLFLGDNQLTGTIPSFQLPNLQGLSLRHNQLSGTIPDFDLPELTALVLDSNQLTGAIPNFNLPELQYLHLGSNQLSGSIPPLNLPYLQSLLLNDNQLTGCIPGVIKTNSPSLQDGGDISNNPGLATQSWSDYWDNGAGVCQPPPTASVLTADQSSLCSGSSTALRVTITGGNSPYTVVYLAFHTRDTVTNYISGSSIPVSPTANTAYSLISVTDATSNTGTGNSGNPIITVTQPTTWYLDADKDKYYISSVLSCTSPGPGYSDKGSPAPGDCDDNNAAVHPNATEICDGIDNNCDGQVDEGFPFTTYYYDGDGDGYGTPNLFIAVKCQIPDNYVTNNQDCDDNNAAIHPGAVDVCDGIDNDCDGQIDEDGPLVTYYFDTDGDGYGDPNNAIQARCYNPQNTVTNNLDCNDHSAAVYPGAPEICDGIDNNCDGQIDEGFPFVTYYRDADGDGYGNLSITIQSSCSQPAGYVTNSGDCDDANASIHPGAVEICGNGIDDNCNGQVDEGCVISKVQVGILNTAKAEGRNQNIMKFTVKLGKKSSGTVQVNYATQNGTAIAGSDYVATSGTVTFAPGNIKQVISVTILGDRTPEPDETFSILLSNPVNARIATAYRSAVGTILNDDGSTVAASSSPIAKQSVAVQALPATAAQTVTISPNPARDNVYVMLKGYSGNVTILLQSADGKLLRQEKMLAISKSSQQSVNVSGLANGIYFIRVLDEKGNPQTEKLVIQR